MTLPAFFVLSGAAPSTKLGGGEVFEATATIAGVSSITAVGGIFTEQQATATIAGASAVTTVATKTTDRTAAVGGTSAVTADAVAPSTFIPLGSDRFAVGVGNDTFKVTPAA